MRYKEGALGKMWASCSAEHAVAAAQGFKNCSVTGVVVRSWTANYVRARGAAR